MVTQTNTNYDLLALCVACEQRPLVYHEKQRLLVSPRKMFMCPYDKSTIIIEICFFNFTKNPQIEVVIRADVSENRLPETKNNFSDYDISQPTPSASLSVPSCSLALEGMRKWAGHFDHPPPSIFLALNFCSLTDYKKTWHNCSLFVNTSFDLN